MKFLVLAGLLAVALAKHEVYIGWKSYYVAPTSDDQARALHALTGELELDFLSYARVDREGLVLVQPQYQESFTNRLESLGISYRVHADDVKSQLDIDDEKIEAWTRESFARNGGRNLPYDNYQSLDVIYNYMDDIAARFPDTVTLVNSATSFEGRPIKYMKISTTNFEDQRKPVIFLDSAMHAREWITPPAVTWAIRKLTEDVTDPGLLNDFDWILIPVANPDGYDFSFRSTRFWRKTRSTNTHSVSGVCPGVDGNRNFDFFWNTVGTSSNPCAETYAGNRAFSEVETQLVRDLLNEYLPRIALYVTVHSYGSMILYSWGHDGSLSSNALGLQTVGVAMAQAIDAAALPTFPRYVVGNSVLVLNYPAAGAAEDYAHSIGVPLTYTYELPGLQSGMNGFHLNPRYIQQVAQETWAGIAVGARRAADMLGFN